MIPAPFQSPAYTVRPDWIDANGHLNLAYYLVLFDWGTDDLWAEICLGDSIRAAGFPEGATARVSDACGRAAARASMEPWRTVITGAPNVDVDVTL